MGLLSVGLTGCGNDRENAGPVEGTASAPPERPAPMQTVPGSATTEQGGGERPSSAGLPAADSGEREAFGEEAMSGGPSMQALLHHRFLLESVDGEDFSPAERTPELEFLEGFRVAGGFCNRFTGQGELDGDVLKVAQMASTKMLCADEGLNRLEGLFAAMMQEGARIGLDGTLLVLEQGGHRLGWRLRDRVR